MRIPAATVYQTRLAVEYAVPTASLDPRVQRGGRPGPPGAARKAFGVSIRSVCTVDSKVCVYRGRVRLPTARIGAPASPRGKTRPPHRGPRPARGPHFVT